jgi:hypothetical protein
VAQSQQHDLTPYFVRAPGAGFAAVLALVALSGCDSFDSASVPPCNAWIIVSGAADIRLDCPSPAPLPVLQRKAP